MELKLPVLCLLSVFYSFFWGSKCLAQDIHFSQFYMSPLTINPAQTGGADAFWRFSANHRNQWRSIGKPFNTSAFAFDRNFYFYNEQFSGGLLYLYDETGGANLKTHKVALSSAYHKKVKKNVFHVGIQPAYVQVSNDLSSVSFPSQYDRSTGIFNSNLANTDPFITNQLSYFDFNIGVNYSLLVNKFRPEVGVSIFHINRPNASFFGTAYQVPIRTLMTAQAEIDLSSTLMLSPNFMYMFQAKASEILYGSNLLLYLNENKINATGVYAGFLVRDGFNRNTDAAVVILGMRFPNLNIGFNYDLNLSELKVASDFRGAYEIGIIYTSPNKSLKKTAIPCERY